LKSGSTTLVYNIRVQISYLAAQDTPMKFFYRHPWWEFNEGPFIVNRAIIGLSSEAAIHIERRPLSIVLLSAWPQ